MPSQIAYADVTVKRVNVLEKQSLRSMGTIIADFQRRFFSPLSVVGCFVGASWLAIAGPFGTFDSLPAMSRIVYWLSVVWVGFTIAVLLRVLVDMVIPQKETHVRLSVAYGLFTVIFAPIAWFLVVFVSETGMPFMSFAMTILAMATFSVGMFAIECGMIVAGFQPATPDTLAASDAPRVVQRLSQDRRGELLRLSGRDHYVDVVTCQGEESLLMRFSDAIGEAEAVDGLQVHRSHWVARSAVTGTVRRKGRVFLTLQDGAEIPVSRGYIGRVQDAGLM